jgi:hypothetical protein
MPAFSTTRFFAFLAAVLLLVTVIVPRYRDKALAYAVDEVPALYPWYQAGVQSRTGTALSFLSPHGAFLALSTPKYNESHNSRVYLLAPADMDPLRVVAATPPLPEKGDPQGIAVYKNELIISNHQGRKDSVVIYDLGRAFAGKLEEIGHIPNLPGPTSVYVHGDQLFVTCAGRHYMRGQGLYVYEKSNTGEWRQVGTYLYRDLFGRHLFDNEYHRWPDIVPSSVVVQDHIAYLVNMVSQSIILVDLLKPPPDAYVGRVAGPASRIYYPAGIYLDGDRFFVAEHVRHYVYTLPAKMRPGDVTALSVFAEASHTMNPFGVTVVNDKVYTASLSPNAIYIFPKDATGIATPTVFHLPDDASVTRMVRLHVSSP